MIKKNHGVIINMSSGAGRQSYPQIAAYCATKWAIEGLTQSLALELPDDMAAVPLALGVINTDMLHSHFGTSAADYQRPEEWAEKAVPFILQITAKDNGKPLRID